MPRVLVTGAAGFVGSHLVRRLLDRGDLVIGMDDFSTGRRSNLADLAGHPRFELREHDVATPYSLAVDQIYNLACPASPVHYQRDPVKTTLTSVLGILHALAVARWHGARVLQASTSEVYGDPLQHPQPETYWGHVNPIGPRACYDEGKRVAETLLFDHARQYGVSVRVARIFNTYGPQMAADDGRVVSNFLVQALRGQPLTVYGDGLQTRSFCYVADLVEGLIRLMDHPDEAGPVNLGNPDEFTMLELVAAVQEVVGRPLEVSFQPLPTDDPVRRRPDITRARERLGWSPQVALRDGLVPTAAWFRSQVG